MIVFYIDFSFFLDIKYHSIVIGADRRTRGSIIKFIKKSMLVVLRSSITDVRQIAS